MTSVTSALLEVTKLPPFQRILVISDNRAMQSKLQQLFQVEGYGVEIVDRVNEVQKLLRNVPPSALVLDLQMAGVSPRRLFEETGLVDPMVPVIVLGESSSVMERVLFLELGASDYMVKPFNDKELLARIRAVLRRSHGHDAEVFAFGEVHADFRKMEVRRQGRLVPLTAMEFKVLKFMIRNAERAIGREELLNEVWGYQNYPTTRTVDNHILKLRQKLEPDPSYPVHFVTIQCIGYRFMPQGAADRVF
jgi:DNA-binding response OmpR family regulator